MLIRLCQLMMLATILTRIAFADALPDKDLFQLPYAYGTPSQGTDIALGIAASSKFYATGADISIVTSLRNGGSSVSNVAEGNLEIKIVDQTGKEVRFEPRLLQISNVRRFSGTFDAGRTLIRIEPFRAGKRGAYTVTAREQILNAETKAPLSTLVSAPIQITITPR